VFLEAARLFLTGIGSGGGRQWSVEWPDPKIRLRLRGPLLFGVTWRPQLADTVSSVLRASMESEGSGVPRLQSST
jgi:hypothetical protein